MGDILGETTVVMPAYNEAEGIVEFLEEILRELSFCAVRFVVVDDASTDATRAALDDAARGGLPVDVHSNARNLGHGPSTTTALVHGVRAGGDVVVAVDGDGQFSGADIARAVRVLLERSDVHVVEGVRTHRTDPLFRRIASGATRRMVRSRCGVPPRDANTPLRVYRPWALDLLLDDVPAGAMTPNLLISAGARSRGLEVVELEVECLPRRGSQAAGSTWGARQRVLPSHRFLAFCRDAVRQWYSASSGPVAARARPANDPSQLAAG